jgi:hypothetical protein
MTGWVRLWHDMPTDPKWRTIARKSNQRVGDVIAVFNFIMVNASENALERGRTHRLDKEDVATALDLSEADLEAILSAMQGKVLDGDALMGWAKRQPKREDFGASKRKAEWKERQRNAMERNGTHGNAPDTDTDTDITLSKDSGASADSDKEFWASAKQYLGGKNPGALIGKWCRDYPKAEVAKAIGAAQVERAVDPIPYVERTLRGAKQGGWEVSLC